MRNIERVVQNIEGGGRVKNLTNIRSRSLLCASAGLLSVTLLMGANPAAAQAPDAADRCTPDVMRLCSEFIPDADRIVACLKSKRKQVSPSCMHALQPSGAAKSKKKRKS